MQIFCRGQQRCSCVSEATQCRDSSRLGCCAQTSLTMFPLWSSGDLSHIYDSERPINLKLFSPCTATEAVWSAGSSPSLGSVLSLGTSVSTNSLFPVKLLCTNKIASFFYKEKLHLALQHLFSLLYLYRRSSVESQPPVCCSLGTFSAFLAFCLLLSSKDRPYCPYLLFMDFSSTWIAFMTCLFITGISGSDFQSNSA